MNYYFHKDRVESIEIDLSITNPDSISHNFEDVTFKDCFIPLDEEQISFYLENPTLTIREVYLRTPSPSNEPTLEELKAKKIAAISFYSTERGNANYDVELVYIVGKGWDDHNLPMCSANAMWSFQCGVERENKITAAENATTKEELDLIDPIPSSLVKPYTAAQVVDEFINFKFNNNV